MTLCWRSLDRTAVASLAEYEHGTGGVAVAATRHITPSLMIDAIDEAGLRGRGGAGFPTGLKLRTVAAARSAEAPTTVVVNAAEGEPGTFKDRALIRANPYRVLEGAIVAAHAVGASEIKVGIKASFHREIQRLESAIEETSARGWFDGLDIALVLGPSSYLFGEETAMLEVVEGRQPFPRVTPPFRRGVEEHDTRSAGGVSLAVAGGSNEAPALVDNVETLANLALIIAKGPAWFRETGTSESPGTIVCTVTGATRRHGVGEVAMGTTLREVIQTIGWGPRPGHEISVVLSGTANALIPSGLLDTPLTYEAMRNAGTGLGSAGFIVFDENSDPVAIAQGVSRFLAVESCGQCEPCKRDGVALSELLGRLTRSVATERQMVELRGRLETVAIGARCNLARQQAEVVDSMLQLFGDAVGAHRVRGALPSDRVPVVPIANIIGGRATLDIDQLRKQPDWTNNEVDSGTSPAARLDNTPVRITASVPTRTWAEWAPEFADEHPLSAIEDAHILLNDLLVDAANAADEYRPVALSKLCHFVRLHVDVTRRILYPMARRYAGEDGEATADEAEQHELSLIALVKRIEGSISSDDNARNALLVLSTELRRHAEHEHELINLMRRSMDSDERGDLANALAEARSTATVR